MDEFNIKEKLLRQPGKSILKVNSINMIVEANLQDEVCYIDYDNF